MFPLGTEWIMAVLATVSPVIDLAESSCLSVVCDGSALPAISLSVTLQMPYVHWCSFAERNHFSYDFLHKLLAS